jgi:hypothetical protein
MRQTLALAVAVAASGCTIETGQEPPDPPSWGVPITGGTMTVSRDGNRAVIADPDRDRVVVVDLTTQQVVDTVELRAGSEPGRVVEDGVGRFHVALRRSGELLTIDGSKRQLRAVCGEPRGVAWQETGDLVHVACATGELVSVPASGGDAVRSIEIERDLRDVIVRDDQLIVTTFRSANVITVDASGAVVARKTLPPVARGGGDLAIAEVAWRTIAMPDGSLVVTHQRRHTDPLQPSPGGYSVSCPTGAVESSVSVISPDGVPVAAAPVMTASLPVDIATDGSQLAMISAGQQEVFTFTSEHVHTGDHGCFASFVTGKHLGTDLGTPTSVAYAPHGQLLVFYPEPSKLVVVGKATIALGGRPGQDEGRALFHRQTAAGLSCASCHPEGRDDGAVWTFGGIGPRRTQSLAGNLMSRAPYHWNGDMKGMSQLVDDVFAQRMGGGEVTDQHKRALGAWLDRIPAPRGVVHDPAAVLRGAALFASPETACSSCHNGELLTNRQLVNVGTYSTVKVPSLIGVGARAPYLHDGCAKTLRDRFGVCGGGDQHGFTSQLDAAQLSDLIAYLESL